MASAGIAKRKQFRGLCYLGTVFASFEGRFGIILASFSSLVRPWGARGLLRRPIRGPLGSPGALLGVLGSLLGVSGAPLGVPWGSLEGRFGVILASFSSLGRPWGPRRVPGGILVPQGGAYVVKKSILAGTCSKNRVLRAFADECGARIIQTVGTPPLTT